MLIYSTAVKIGHWLTFSRYHVTISRAQVKSKSRVFHWIAGKRSGYYHGGRDGSEYIQRQNILAN